MGLRTSISRWIATKVLSNSKTSRAVLEALAGRGILFFRETEDHGMLYFPHDVIGREITRTGSFARESVRHLRAQLEQHQTYKPDMTVLEIGANIGTHTIYFFCDLGCNKVIAIEPDPENLSILKRNAALNGLGDQVVPVCAAVSDKSGKAEFVRNNLNRGGSHLVEGSDYGKQTDIFPVDILTIDSLLTDLDLTPSDIDLVWIDVEGHECQVLEGMSSVLAKQRPPIFLEYTPKADPAHTQKIRALMFNAYEHVYKYQGGFHPLSKDAFDRLEGQHDILLIN